MTERQLVYSPRARKDLQKIWRYTAGQWDTDQADEYVRILNAACEQLASGLIEGRSEGHLRTGYRSWPAGSHVVYFRVTRTRLTVVRLLHQRMDPGLYL